MVMAYLALCWRQKLVALLHTSYFRLHNFYVLNHFHAQDVDNPDQRIAEDAEQFATALASLFQSASVPFVVIFYTQRVAGLLGWMGPVTIYGYFVVGSVINKFLMSRVAESVWRQEKLEGTFRYGHARLRAQSEQVAMYRGGQHEQAVLTQSFNALFQNALVLLQRRFSLDVSKNIFAYFGGFLSYVIVGLVLRFGTAFDGIQDPGVFAGMLQQASFLSIMLISAFSNIVNLSSVVSDLAGFTARVAEPLEVMSSSLRINSFDVQDGRVASDDCIACEGLDVETPDGLLLVPGLSFSVSRGQSLLVQGPSGCGKSSLARILHGLWPIRKGTVFCPKQENVFFVPQTPYLVSGTLADQLWYPQSGSEARESEVVELLSTAGLTYLCHRYSVFEVCDWDALLSPGERQKIGMARLFKSGAEFAVLDESTSAMTLEDEAKMYRLLQSRQITYISVGHRPSLVEFHKSCLKVENGSWKIEESDQERDAE